MFYTENQTGSQQKPSRHLHPFCFHTFDDGFISLTWWGGAGGGAGAGLRAVSAAGGVFQTFESLFCVRLIVFYVFIKKSVWRIFM